MPLRPSGRNFARCPGCKNVNTISTKPWSDGCRRCLSLSKSRLFNEQSERNTTDDGGDKYTGKGEDIVVKRPSISWWAVTAAEAEYLVRGFPPSGRHKQKHHANNKKEDVRVRTRLYRDPDFSFSSSSSSSFSPVEEDLGVPIPTLRCKLCHVVGFVGGVSSRTGLNVIGLPTAKPGSNSPPSLDPWKRSLKHTGKCPGQHDPDLVELIQPNISWEEAKYLNKAVSGGTPSIGENANDNRNKSRKLNVMATYEYHQEHNLRPGMIVVGSDDSKKADHKKIRNLGGSLRNDDGCNPNR